MFNYGAGLEYKGEKYGGYVSFRTDFSSFDPKSDIAVTRFDLYRANLGTTVGLRKTTLMIGLGYTWGSDKVNQVIDLNPGEGAPVLDPEDQVELVFTQLAFMIGFSVNL